MARIIVPTPLRKFTGNETTIVANAKNVKEAIDELLRKYPDIKPHLKNEQGQIRSFVNIFVGDQDIRDLDKEQTPVQEGTVISIVPAIAGGQCAHTSIELTIGEVAVSKRLGSPID